MRRLLPLALLLGLTGCGLHPMYSGGTSGPVASMLARVEVAPIAGKAGWLVGSALVYVVGAMVWVRSPLWGQITWFNLPVVIGGFDKTYLSLFRLAHILAVAYLVVAIPAVSRVLRRGEDNPLAIFGKRSLPVFIAGTLLAMVAQVMKLLNPGGFIDDALLLTTGIVAQFALAYYLEWLHRTRQGERAKPLPAPAGAEKAALPVAAAPVGAR